MKARWPGVVGVIGIVLAILTLLDKTGDLLIVTLWTADDWVRWLEPELGPAVARVLPPAPWIALTSLVWLGLAILLLRGSRRLRSRRRSGIALCRLWAVLAISWYALEMVFDLWWLRRVGPLLSELAPAGWQGTAAVGIVLGSALMLAYPAFLLAWLSGERLHAVRWA